MIVMKITLLFVLILACIGVDSSVIRRKIWYNDYPRAWQDAQKYCQYAGGELLTIVTQSEIDNMNMDNYYAWIGLSRYYYYSWKWLDGTWANNDFQRHEPHDVDDCALTHRIAGKAIGDICGHRHFFFCHYWEHNIRKFSFHPESKSWQEASQSCQGLSQVLAVLKHWSNRPSKDKRDFPVWTGMYHDSESWRWSDGEHSHYRNWAAGSHPDLNPCPGLCGAVWSQNKSMSIHCCSEVFPYLCYSHNLVLVKENLTWEEALEHCRSLETVSPYIPHRLLSVEPSELVYANSKAMYAQTDKVWLGLRFLGESWFWSNGQTVSLSGLPSCPESKLSCGALVLDRASNGSEPQPTIELYDCSERLNLLCYRL